jgi:hypothetical protein
MATKKMAPNNVLMTVGVNWDMDGDRLLSVGPGESITGAVSLGQLVYFATDSIPTALHRLFYRYPMADHMASVDPDSETQGFTYEGVQGYLWADSTYLQSLRPFRRYYSTTGDHDVGFTNPNPAQYNEEGILGYALPRYGNLNEDLDSLGNVEVAIAINKVAGGSVWQVSWNGKEFINHWDYGRQIQIDVTYGNDSINNPTEAGDRWCRPQDLVLWRHGSPLISIGSSSDGDSISTLTYPLQWMPETHHGISWDADYISSHVVLWTGKFGKTILLNVFGDPTIIRWTSSITFPDTGNGNGNFDLGIPDVFLNAQFNRYYIYNHDSLLALKLNEGENRDPQYFPEQTPNPGGAIVATADSAYALGLYQSGLFTTTADGFAFTNNTHLGGYGPADYGNSRVSAVLRRNQTTDSLYGTVSWSVYVVIGTLTDCVSRMDTIKSHIVNEQFK